MKRRPSPDDVLGWREWVALPDLGISAVKAKVDTGARSSSLHAYDVRYVRRGGHRYVRFDAHPVQRNDRRIVHCEAPLHDERYVRSSNGKRELRPVIRTTCAIDGREWAIDLTLTSRDTMGFRMLLGREAIRGRFIVDAGRSYLYRKLVPKRKKPRA